MCFLSVCILWFNAVRHVFDTKGRGSLKLSTRETDRNKLILPLRWVCVFVWSVCVSRVCVDECVCVCVRVRVCVVSHACVYVYMRDRGR